MKENQEVIEVKEILKPCPFCGKKDGLVLPERETYEELVRENGKACISLSCRHCNLDMYEHTHSIADYGTRLGLLIAKWNNRPNEVTE